jgi:hypothetical protein
MLKNIAPVCQDILSDDLTPLKEKFLVFDQ